MRFRTLGKTGLSVSALSLGTSPFGGVFGDVGFDACKRCLDTALDLGINLLDCSPFYGLTKAETMLGRTLKNVPRDKYMLATKVGRYGEDEFDFSHARVIRSVDESLARLGLDYVDIIQCHDIEFGDLNQIWEETLPALREVVQAGKARFVGITGLPLQVFREVIARAQVDTILSYCHTSLNDTTLESLLPFLEQHNVGILSASPLSMGLLTGRGAPDWHPAPAEIKDACRRAVELCESRGASIEKLALQFALANPRIATTLVGTSKAEEVENNVRWLQEPMDEHCCAQSRRCWRRSKINRGRVDARRTVRRSSHQKNKIAPRAQRFPSVFLVRTPPFEQRHAEDNVLPLKVVRQKKSGICANSSQPEKSVGRHRHVAISAAKNRSS